MATDGAENSGGRQVSPGSKKASKLAKLVQKRRREGFGDTPTRKLLKQFCESTSAHGFHKLFQGASLWHRAAWLVIIVTAVSGFTAHLLSLFSRYFDGPVNTEASVYSTKFVFPDVTICATSHFSKLRFESNPPVRSLNITTKQLVHHIRNFWDPSNSSEVNSEINGDLMNSMKTYLSELNITKQRQEMILHCDFAGSRCSYENFTAYIDPNYFSCFTFAPSERHLLVGGEKDGGLTVIMYVGDIMNFITQEESLSYSKGFRAVVHEKGTRPEMLEGFYVQQSTSTYVQLGYTEEIVLRNCTDELNPIEFVDRNGDIKQYRYTIRDCLMEVYQLHLRNICKCTSEMLPLPAKLQNDSTIFCHSISEDNLLEEAEDRGISTETMDDNTNTETRRLCHDHAVEEIHRKTSDNKHNCSLRCNNTRYDMRVTQNKWPSDAGETQKALLKAVQRTKLLAARRGDDLTTLEEIENRLLNEPNAIRSFARLNIYSHSTMGNVVRESWAYLARNLASDIGGILGLWLGVSIISTFEFFELFFQLVASRRRREEDGTDRTELEL